MELKQTKEEDIGTPRTLRGIFEHAARVRQANPAALGGDLCVFFLALLYARTHLVFGAYPLALAFLGALPGGRVWIALCGAALGAFSMGSSGIIYAVGAVFVVCLRTIIGTARQQWGELFREGLLLRVCAAVVGGFAGGVYTLLLHGITLESVSYLLAMVLLPGAICLLFCGLFGAGITTRRFFLGGDIFSAGAGQDRYALVLFQGSFLVYAFFTVYALGQYSLFGISPGYILAALLTLFVAKRFGAPRAMAVGFCSLIGLSPIDAVAFALAGGAGALVCAFGDMYALLGGAAALIGWSALAGGLQGFLSTFPEYAVGALCAYPLLRKTQSSHKETTDERGERKLATDMVGTMALSYRGRSEKKLDKLESALSSLAPLVRKLSEEDARPSLEDYRQMCRCCCDTYCKSCDAYAACMAEKRPALTTCADTLAVKLYAGDSIGVSDLSEAVGGCQRQSCLLDTIRQNAARLHEQQKLPRATGAIGDTCEMLSKMMNEARCRQEREAGMNEETTGKLERVFSDAGFPDGIIRAFGEEHPTVIAAAEDADGTRITDPALRRSIEEALGAKLSSPEYFRRDRMVLMECHATGRYRVEIGTAAAAGSCAEISGDTVRSFCTENTFGVILSDGMGSGQIANTTSRFCAEMLCRTLRAGCSAGTALHLLNRILHSRTEECSATVDLFTMDLISGEASFSKSGAAASYLKRGCSVFRIRSSSAPLGLMDEVDAERIKVEVGCGDYVVLVSDGISQNTTDAPWLATLLAEPTPAAPEEMAKRILESAKHNTSATDDMSVAVLRIGLTE